MKIFSKTPIRLKCIKSIKMNHIKILTVVIIILSSCRGIDHAKKDNNLNVKTMAPDSSNQYGFNREFLKRHITVIELKNGISAITLVPAWQARVMTSSADGDQGFSFGWINRSLIASGKILPHINAFGGEERLWLGPEGGQFSIFFDKDKQFIYENWQTPEFLDTKPFQIVATTDSSALFRNDITTQNYSGTTFIFRIEREVSVLSETEIIKLISTEIKGLKYVAYRSENKLINKGVAAWEKKSGLLSIWMLGMFNPSPAVNIVIPVKPGEEKLIGPIVNDTYFGRISGDRLKVSGNHVFFKADGKSRGKIGIPQLRATGVMGSYDSENKILTLLICILPEGKKDYVNSSWQIQENPYSGDALNSYNDGPLEDGTQMGPFYELETSSPAADLKPGESLSHIQYTLHFTGDPALLDKVTRKVLGVNLNDIISAF
jgi:hypothetical protein